MFSKNNVAAFFDRMALAWDETCVHNPEKIRAILDDAAIEPGVTVLDVACGTGVLFPFYLERGAARITGVDLSPAMINHAAAKFSDPAITLLCADIEELTFPEPFDRCVVYSALPHFPDPRRLIERLAGFVRAGGRLTVAHSESAETINQRHLGHAEPVSIALIPADRLAQIFEPFFAVDVLLSDEERYVVSGVRR